MEEQELRKELILINPPSGNYFIRIIFSLFMPRNTPLSLLTIAALTPKDYTVKILSPRFWLSKKYFRKGTLVGITCLTLSAKQGYALAVRFRQTGATIVMGGPHVSALPEEALKYCDSVVIGEAESVWGQVISDFQNRSLKRIYNGVPLDDFFSPVYDYFMRLNPKILRRAGLKISRGCKYNCEFCARSSSVPRYLKIEQLVMLVKKMKSSVLFPKTFLFLEDNIFSDPRYAKKVFRALIPLKIKWSAQSSIDIAFDDEALSLAAQSGCKNVLIGFETIYPKKMRKTSIGSLATTNDYILAIKRIKSHGIKVVGAFIAGFDYYSHIDYLKLLLFLMVTMIRSRMYFILLTILTPFPGTKLFKQLEEEGRIKTYNWNRYDLMFNVVFKPKQISVFSLMTWFVLIRVVSIFCCTYILLFYLYIYAGFFTARILKLYLLTH